MPPVAVSVALPISSACAVARGVAHPSSNASQAVICTFPTSSKVYAARRCTFSELPIAGGVVVVVLSWGCAAVPAGGLARQLQSPEGALCVAAPEVAGSPEAGEPVETAQAGTVERQASRATRFEVFMPGPQSNCGASARRARSARISHESGDGGSSPTTKRRQIW